MSKTRVEVEYNYNSLPRNNNNMTLKKFAALKRKYKNAKRQMNTHEEGDLKEKLLCSSCYFTFGLTGLIFILINFSTNRPISGLTFLHTLQSLFIGGVIAGAIFLVQILSSLSTLLINILQGFQGLCASFYTNLPLIILTMAIGFSVITFLGKSFLLPGVNTLANRILNNN